MKKLLLILGIAIAIISLHSCSSTPLGTCNASNSFYQLLYNNLVTDTTMRDDTSTMDLDTHSYTFRLAANMTLCEVGYRAHPNMGTTPYTIRITDLSTTSVVYSQNLIFSTSAASFHGLSAPLSLLSGRDYKVERICPSTVPLGDNMGRVVRKRSGGLMTFPVTYSNFNVVASSFYGRGGPVNSWGIPYIVLVLN